MNIFVINKSTVLTDAEVEGWMPSFNKFLGHVRYWWPRAATLKYAASDVGLDNNWKIIFADSSDQAGALGYHDFTPDGRPISYIFAADGEKYGYSPTVIATHEIAEMIADPWISQMFQISNTKFFAQEICDPCEGDEFGYEIDGVLCSDFVTPRWFIPGSDGSYVFDSTKHISQPLELLAGGYMSVFVSGKGWTQIYADKVKGEVVQADKDSKGGYGRLSKYGRDREEIVLTNGE